MEDLSLIKVSLEYAQFKDWRIREGVMNAIKALDADLDDVQFTASINTKQVFDELQTAISDVETKMEEERVETDKDDDDDVVDTDIDFDDDTLKKKDESEDEVEEIEEDELEIEVDEDEDDENGEHVELDEDDDIETDEIAEDRTQQS